MATRVMEIFATMKNKIHPTLNGSHPQLQEEEMYRDVEDNKEKADETEEKADFLDSSFLRYQFQWQTDSLIAALSYNVNLKSIWTLPYLAVKYGGSAFFIPYSLTFLLLGYPLYYMELGLSQYSSHGVLKLWKMHSIF